MNTEHQRKHLNFKKRGVTLVFGDSIGKNVIAAMTQAEAIAQTREFGQVLYLNTFQTEESLDETCAAAIHRFFTVNTQDIMSIESSTVGELANDQGMMVRRLTGHFPAKVIIINSWEFAARDCRLRERLLFRVNEWVTHYGASVIIYAEARTRTYEIGKCQYGGLGKLMALAKQVENICGKPLERDPRYIDYEHRVDAMEKQKAKEKWEYQKQFIPVIEKDIETAFRVSQSESVAVREVEHPEPIAEETVIEKAPQKDMHPQMPQQPTIRPSDYPELGLSIEEFLDQYARPKTPSVHSQVVEKYEGEVVVR